jgi:hypothetical protein
MRLLLWKVAAFFPPDRPFGGSELASEAGGQFLDRLRRVNDRVNVRIELLDALAGLREAAAAARQGKATGGARHCQYMST